MLGDEIKIMILDASGNQTLVSYISFKSDDGKYLVTSKGGVVEGEGGTRLEIPEGALIGPTVVKITPLAEDQLAHPVPQGGRYLAAVNIDTGRREIPEGNPSVRACAIRGHDRGPAVRGPSAGSDQPRRNSREGLRDRGQRQGR